jgi:hypothetical protein
MLADDHRGIRRSIVDATVAVARARLASEDGERIGGKLPGTEFGKELQSTLNTTYSTLKARKSRRLLRRKRADHVRLLSRLVTCSDNGVLRNDITPLLISFWDDLDGTVRYALFTFRSF